jgi:hypothetical protein
MIHKIKIYKDNECNLFTHTHMYFIIYMNINRIYITLIPLACSKVLMRERLQFSVNNTVVLFTYL